MNRERAVKKGREEEKIMKLVLGGRTKKYINITEFETNSNVQNSNDQNKHAMAILVDFF